MRRNLVLSVARCFGRRKAVTQPAKSVAQLLETCTSKESFFPEYLETLTSASLLTFYEKHKESFSPTSVLHALNAAKRHLASDPSPQTAALADELRQKAISILPAMTKEQLNFYLKILSSSPTPEETTAIMSHPFEVSHDATSLVFYLRSAPGDSPAFSPNARKLKEVVLSGGKAEVQGHNLLLDLMELYMSKLHDYDVVVKLEEKLKQHAACFTLKTSLRVLEIYSLHPFKRPDFELLDVVLHNCTNHMSKIGVMQLLSVLEQVLKLGAESADLFSKAARHVLLAHEGGQATIDQLSYAFYLLARLEFGNYIFYDQFFARLTESLATLSAKGLFHAVFAHAKRTISRSEEYHKRKGLYHKRALKLIQKANDDFYLNVFPLLKGKLGGVEPTEWLGVISAARNSGVKKLAVKRALVDISLAVLEGSADAAIKSETFFSIVKQVEPLMQKASEAR